MSGLLRRLRRTSTPAPETGDAPTAALPTAAAEAPAPAAEPAATGSLFAPTPNAPAQLPTREALPGADSAVAAPAAEVPANEAPAERPQPAGVAPDELVGERPDTRRRSRLRRRLRHLRRVRELMLRDLGGLVYEVHRTHVTDDASREHQATLIQGKVERLAALDAERHELETVLGDRRTEVVLREPGVGGTCASCGDYLPSDAKFCARCGTPAEAVPVPAQEGPAPAAEEAPAPAEPEAIEPAATADGGADATATAETAETPTEVRT